MSDTIVFPGLAVSVQQAVFFTGLTVDSHSEDEGDCDPPG